MTGDPPQLHKNEILVLYGSQTGNSQAAAEEIASLIPSNLTSSATSSEASINSCKPFSARHMQLDDFLEIEKAAWTPLVIIVTSSYGVGQAPLGCYKFRALCDLILSKPEEEVATMLHGVKYALLGLGDSKYTTFFNNPTIIDQALSKAGAQRLGPVGKADASGSGEHSQQNVIDHWIKTIWTYLDVSLVRDERILLRAREMTLDLCIEMDTAMLRKRLMKKSRKEKDSPIFDRSYFLTRIVAPILFLLIARFVQYLMRKESN